MFNWFKGGNVISKPLNKIFTLNGDCSSLLSSYKTITEIPVGKHLGAFGAVCHLYCNS